MPEQKVRRFPHAYQSSCLNICSIRKAVYGISLIYNLSTLPHSPTSSDWLSRSHASINPSLPVWNRQFHCSQLGIKYCWHFTLRDSTAPSRQVSITELCMCHFPFKITRLSINGKPPDKYFKVWLSESFWWESSSCSVERSVSLYSLWCLIYFWMCKDQNFLLLFALLQPVVILPLCLSHCYTANLEGVVDKTLLCTLNLRWSAAIVYSVV